MICGSGGSKRRLAKAAGAEPAGQMTDEKLHTVVARSTFRSQNVKNTSGPLLEVQMSKKWTPLWREAHFEVKMDKKHTIVGPLLEVEMSKKCTLLWREAHFEVKMYKAHLRTTFGSWDAEKVHAVVARSTFRSQNVKNTSGPLLEVQMSKKWTPLWREAHFEVKMDKKHTIVEPLLEVQMSLRVAGARDCAPCQKWAKRGGFVAFSTTTTTTPHYTPIHYIQLHSITLNYTQLHYITLHYTPLHYTTLHYTTLHWMTLHHR